MGAEMVAEKYGLTKDQLDEYGYLSHQRAIAGAILQGREPREMGADWQEASMRRMAGAEKHISPRPREATF